MVYFSIEVKKMVARLTEEQLNYFDNPDFYQDYMEMFIFRLTFSNMAIERDLGEIADSKNAIRLRDNYRAFQKLLTMFSYDMSEDLIIDIANTINKSSMYISNGYRKLGRTLGDTNEPISDPKDIKSDMEKLLYNYYNEWNNLDPYLREAKFNIEFLRIHPFEDGNGRTSRLLLNFNLMKQKIAPVIITDDLVDDYFNARNNFDEEWIANMFRVQSEKEIEVIDGLTKELKKENEGLKL
jgi:prophage maintenance system killer protein